jgi:hypothetical protein
VYTVKRLLEREGWSEAYEIHKIPPFKLHEMFGADLVLYPIIEHWDAGSAHEATISVQLRDRDGNFLWSNYAAASYASNTTPVPFLAAIENVMDDAILGFQFYSYFISIRAVNMIFDSAPSGVYVTKPTDSIFPVGPYYLESDK